MRLRLPRRRARARAGDLSPLSTDQVDHFHEQGFLTLPGLMTAAEVDLVNDAVDAAWEDKSIYNSLVVSAYTNTERYVETFVRNAPADVRAHPYKLNHLHIYDCGVLDLLLGPKLATIVRQLLQGTPLLFNTLNLEWGSEQRLHFDTFFMAPTVPNKMVVAWFALGDVHPDSGPLSYYPGSHLIEPFRFADGSLHPSSDEEMAAFDEYIEKQIANRGLRLQSFCPSAGDVFLWHAQLYHGGSPIRDRQQPRRSMVAHYWRAEDYPPEMRMPMTDGRAILNPRFMWVATAFREHI